MEPSSLGINVSEIPGRSAGLGAGVHAGLPGPAENLGVKRIDPPARPVKPSLTRCAAARSDEAKDQDAKLSQPGPYLLESPARTGEPTSART